MNDLQVFGFEGAAVRVVDVKGEPWWVAKDVADVLGYRMASDMARMLDDDERGTHKMRTVSGDQEMTIINESGLYSAILRSEKPEAKAFKKWITAEVLPAIRKTGTYGKPKHSAADIREWRLSFKGRKIPVQALAGYYGYPLEWFGEEAMTTGPSCGPDVLAMILDYQAYKQPDGVTIRALLEKRDRESDKALEPSGVRRYWQNKREYFIVGVNSRYIARILAGVKDYDKALLEHPAFEKSGTARIDGECMTVRFFRYGEVVKLPAVTR